MSTVIAIEIAIVLWIMLIFGGSSEPPTWGRGDLPETYLANFGNSNNARLNYVQNQVIDKHNEILKVLAKRLLALEAVDPNEVTK